MSKSLKHVIDKESAYFDLNDIIVLKIRPDHVQVEKMYGFLFEISGLF